MCFAGNLKQVLLALTWASSGTCSAYWAQTGFYIYFSYSFCLACFEVLPCSQRSSSHPRLNTIVSQLN
jgi:hypothetical protein